MPIDTLTEQKKYFAEMVALPSAGHKLIKAAQTLRETYPTLTGTEKAELVSWIKLISDLDKFVTGEDQSYYTSIAIIKRGFRRANLEHLAKYSSEDVGSIVAEDERDDEYRFNIWNTEFQYIKTFLNQFAIEYRILN